MSKKRRRYYRRARPTPRAVIDQAKDRHHVFYQGRHYKNGALTVLRHHPYAVAMIPRNTLHRMIHEFLGDVPAPSHINAQSALDQLRSLEFYGVIGENDTIQRRLQVFIALFDCVEQPTADALKKQLAIVRKFYHEPS